MLRRMLAATVLTTIAAFALVTTAAWCMLLVWTGYQGVWYVIQSIS